MQNGEAYISSFNNETEPFYGRVQFENVYELMHLSMNNGNEAKRTTNFVYLLLFSVSQLRRARNLNVPEYGVCDGRSIG